MGRGKEQDTLCGAKGALVCVHNLLVRPPAVALWLLLKRDPLVCCCWLCQKQQQAQQQCLDAMASPRV
jgi:hypothetical protein